ncbi:MAG: spore photoproduct lyase family protein, partial [Armatimonadota bacterium]
HGMYRDIDPVVILNLGRFDDPEEVRRARLERYPTLCRGTYPLSGYDGFHWRRSGSPKHRRETGMVCQPAWQIHSAWGCHYRCAYCSLGHYVTLMVNVEEFVERLPGLIDRRAPKQTLFQYDNGTDIVAFEPEYGASQLLIDFFAHRQGQFLELYVGKSSNVDFLLNLDHRGHTVCCWSLAGRTQSVEIEWLSAPMEERIEASRRCQQAGYHVRHRFSPIIPVRNWREEIREMIELLFARVQPDVITFETLRYMDHQDILADFDPEMLDPKLLEVMRRDEREEIPDGCQIPDSYRHEVYRFVIDELERVSPQTPYAFCREQRTTWERFADDFARHGQQPDRYVCNCAPYSAPGDPLLRTTSPVA